MNGYVVSRREMILYADVLVWENVWTGIIEWYLYSSGRGRSYCKVLKMWLDCSQSARDCW